MASEIGKSASLFTDFAGCYLPNISAQRSPFMFVDPNRSIQSATYRARLEAMLLIPVDSSDERIHTLIEAGFKSGSVSRLLELGIISAAVRDQIIPYTTLKRRLERGQRLSTSESDRLFRIARVIAMAGVVFGDEEKAKRWLSTPKFCFSGKNPLAMLTTFQGSHLVEEMLNQAAEGFTF
ncbi:antitoxin Xre/MbcA/ParS toxin-binding domain-containing protein [Pseudomonas arsenicoxydans]